MLLLIIGLPFVFLSGIILEHFFNWYDPIIRFLEKVLGALADMDYDD